MTRSYPFSLGFALALFTAAPSTAQTLTAWDQPINVSATDGTLVKTGGCDGCPDAGAHSRTLLSADGYAEFTAVAGHLATAGLGSDLSSSTALASIEYAITLWPNGAFEVRERGVYVGEGAFAD